MSSYLRTIEKRILKRMGYRREPATKWVIENDKPVLKVIPKEERQILNPFGLPVGKHYPRRLHAAE